MRWSRYVCFVIYNYSARWTHIAIWTWVFRETEGTSVRGDPYPSPTRPVSPLGTASRLRYGRLNIFKGLGCGYVRVCAGMGGDVRACAGMCGYVRVCAGMCGYVRVCAGMCGYVRVRS